MIRKRANDAPPEADYDENGVDRTLVRQCFAFDAGRAGTVTRRAARRLYCAWRPPEKQHVVADPKLIEILRVRRRNPAVRALILLMARPNEVPGGHEGCSNLPQHVQLGLAVPSQHRVVPFEQPQTPLWCEQHPRFSGPLGAASEMRGANADPNTSPNNITTMM